MEGQLLDRLTSIENRLSAIEDNVGNLMTNIGFLKGKAESFLSGSSPDSHSGIMDKEGLIKLTIKFIIFPLIIVVGGVVGVKVWDMAH